MNYVFQRLPWLVLAAGLAAGCGRPPEPAPALKPAIDGSKYLAAAEPANARGVIALRKEAQDGDDVVVVGRVGGSKEPVIKGRAAFTIVDLTLKGCAADGPDCFDFA